MAKLPSILLLGANHHSASLEIREKLSLTEEEVDTMLFALKQSNIISEVLVLSTCNRVEFLLVSGDAPKARAMLFGYLAARKNLNISLFDSCFYEHTGLEAVRHLFRVSASLDSMVLGEPQILGQVKQAYQRSTRTGAAGPILNRMLHRAFQVAKRVRTETGIGDNAVSISYAAVELARKIFGKLEGKKILLIGAGEMAELAVEHLIRQKPAGFCVVNRTFERGEALACRFGGRALPMEEMLTAVADADIVISSTGSTDYVVRKPEVRTLMKKRQNRSLFFIDIAVPRDVDPAINTLDNAYVYDIDDLQGVVNDNLDERKREAERAESFVNEAVARFREWVEGLALVPIIKALREKIGTTLEEELRRSIEDFKQGRVGESEAVGRALDAMITKVLHDPITLLKSGGMHGNRDRYLSFVRLLFKLDDVPVDKNDEADREKIVYFPSAKGGKF